MSINERDPAVRASLEPFDWRRLELSKYSLVLAAIVLFGFFAAQHGSSFASMRSVTSMINSQSILVMLAIASTITLRNGDFDLSLAGTAILSGAVLGQLTLNHGVPLVFAALAAIACGLVVGLLNALLVVFFDLDALVVTLGMFTLLSGLALAISGGTVLTGFPASLTDFARQEFLGMPLATWYGWLIVLIAYYVYEHTPVGRYMYFTGGNREATRLAGVRVQRIRTGAFLVGGAVAAFAGVVLAGVLGGLDPTAGAQYLLQPFAAAFLGATAFTVGRFNALGTLAALYFLVIGITGIQLYGLAGWVTDAFNGLALIIAILAAGLAERRRRARGEVK